MRCEFARDGRRGKEIVVDFSVRWIGEIENMPIIGLESLNSTLPGKKEIFFNHSMIFQTFLGYTDGICPFDNQRYFKCPPEHGYYVLESGFNESYKIVQAKRDGRKDSDSDEEYNSRQFV